LGRSWQNRTGNIYWGYTGTINAPINEPQIASIFTPIFRQIINTFSEQRTREQVLQTLQNIKDLCDTAADELDAAAANLEAYNCVYHIWSRLRILMSEGNFLIKHQEAAEGDLF
jgi:hypothetical protein